MKITARPFLRCLTVLAVALAGLAANAAAAYAVGAPSFSALPAAGPGGQYPYGFSITVTSNPNSNTGGNNINCIQSVNGGGWYNVGGSVYANGSYVTDTWSVTIPGLHQVYCTAQGANGSTAQTGSPGAPAISFVYDPTVPTVWANLSGGSGANGWYNSAPGVYESDAGDGVYGGWIPWKWCNPVYNQGANTETCYAETAAGNVGAGSTTVYYDTVPPSVWTNISGGSERNGWYSSPPAISPGAWDGTSGVWYDSCTGLSNGINYVTCSATDVAGNSATDAATQINLDTTEPSVAYNSGPLANVWYTHGSLPSMAVVGSTTGGSGVAYLTCNGDGLPTNYTIAGASGTIPAADLNQGAGQISCTSTSGAGLTSSAATRAVNIDDTVPTVAFNTTESASAWYTHSSLPSITVNGSTTGGSGVAHLACNGDGLPSNYTITGASGTIPLADLNQGAGQITCSSTSGASVTSTTAKVTVNVDDTVPSVAFSTTGTASLWYTHNNLPTISLNASTTGGSGIDHITCNGDGLPSNYTITGASGALPTADLDQGAGQLTCSSTSGAGVTSSTATRAVNIDDTVPTVAFSSSASSSVWYSSASAIPTVSVTSTSGPSGIAAITCDAPDATNVLTAASGTLDLSTLRNGADAITCTPATPAGVTGSPVSLQVNLDAQTPTLTFAGRATQTKWYAAVAAIPELDTDAVTGPSGVGSIDCAGDGIASQSAASRGAAVNLTGLRPGTGAVTCTATSVSGLTSRPQTFTLNLDGAGPSAAWRTSQSQRTWYPSTASVPALNVDATAGGASGVDHITCRGDGITGNATISGASGTVQPAGFANGANTISCVPTSGAGVDGAAITRTVLVDSTHPAIALSGTDDSAWYPAAQTVTADASADTNPSGVQSIGCAVDQNAATVTDGTSATQVVSGDGVHAVTCQALSGAGVQGVPATATVKIDTQTPTVTQTVVPAGPSDPAGTVRVLVTAAEANPLSGIASTSCSLDQQTPTVAQGNKQTVAITSAGSHTLTCTATTQAGVTSGGSTQTYTVDSDPGQFSLQYGAVPSAWQAAAVTVPVQLTGATAHNYSSLTCTLNGASPTTINGTSGTVAVTASGSQQVACYATGQNGANTAAVAQTVKIDKQTPTASWSTSGTATGEQVTLIGSEPTPLSGIASESCSLDGGSAQTATAADLTIAVNGNGSHHLACTITTAAGVAANVTYTANVAVPVPAPVTVSAPDPSRWYHATQTIVLGIPTGGPAVASVLCTQGGVSTTYAVTGSTVTVSASASGQDVRCVDVDASGTQSAPVDFPVRIDTGSPTGYFVQTGPTQAVASIANPGASAIQSVTMQYRIGTGPWVTLPGSYDASSGEIAAALPSALEQPGVQYTLQAIAVNAAGGRAVINTMQDGTPATGSAPDPDAGAAVSGGLYLGTVPPGGRVRVMKLVPATRTVKVKVGGRTLAHTERVYKTVTKLATAAGRTVTRRVKVPVMRKTYVWQINTATLAQILTVDYGQTVSLAGTLTLASGQVAGQTATVVQQIGGRLAPITATTNAEGTFNVTLPVGASRTVTYTIDGVSHTVTLRVRAKRARHHKRHRASSNAHGRQRGISPSAAARSAS